jgi:hypothetical protein
MFVKFNSPGVSKFAYTVVGGYTRRGNFSPDDFIGVVNYGPSGFQLQMNSLSMFFQWTKLLDLSSLPLHNIVGFEFGITNSFVATEGLNGMGGLALDQIQYTNTP